MKVHDNSLILTSVDKDLALPSNQTVTVSGRLRKPFIGRLTAMVQTSEFSDASNAIDV